MRIFLGLILLALPLPVLGQLDCAVVAPIPPTATDKILQTDAALDAFKGLLKVPPISAKAAIKVSLVHRDVLSKYPNADVLALRQQELSYVCQLLNHDHSLSLTQKISIFQKVGEGIIIEDDPKKPRANKAPVGKPGSPAQPSVQQLQFGAGSIAQNGNNNSAVINNPPVNKYAITTTYRVDGTKDGSDPSAGVETFDQTLQFQYFVPIREAEEKNDWATVLHLSEEAISAAPEWFTPYFYLGAANLSLCHRSEGINALNLFIGKASGAAQYAQLVRAAKEDIAKGNKPIFVAACPN